MYDIEFVNGKQYALFEQHTDVHQVLNVLARCMMTTKLRSEDGKYDYVEVQVLRRFYKRHNLEKILDCLEHIECADVTVSWHNELGAFHARWRLTNLGLSVQKHLKVEQQYMLPL